MYNSTENKGAYIGMDLPISSANVGGTGLMLCERAKFTAHNGRAVITNSNSNLNGSTGDYYDLIGGATTYGTYVYRIIVKAQGSVNAGMVRLFHKINGASTRLIYEIEIPAVTQSSQDITEICIINEVFYLADGHTLRVTATQSGVLNVTAEGQDIAY